MTERVERLRRLSLDTEPRISAERARLMTEFYLAENGRHSVPVQRAKAFWHLCATKTIYLGDDELIVGERGPAPKLTPTFPELTCHSAEDLRVLDSRPLTWYRVDDEVVETYEQTVIPYWQGRSMRDRLMGQLPPEWHAAYEAGVFTEFMEQRAPGHTVADGKMYAKGMRGFQADIAAARAALDWETDPDAHSRDEQLQAMHIAAEAVIVFSQRHADLARVKATTCADAARAAELLRIAEVCERVPAEPPRNFWEALQMYWWCHLAVITELNGWDSFNPGHLDQHLAPFYAAGLADGSLDRERATELLECFWVKFNNHPAPPKVGVTAAESGTYTDFCNINLGGVRADGSDAVNDVSYLLLEVIDEMHLLQPSNNIQLSRQNPDHFLHAACRVIRQGYGFPSVFNCDAVIEELLRQGKSIADARAAGTSGCVEAGAFGKEAYVLTGYFNLPKVLELTLNNGRDPRTGRQLGPRTGEAREFGTYDQLFAAWQTQVRHFVDIKVRGNQLIERMYAKYAPAPFLSILIDDCIAKGRDYNAGGARYNTSYIQGVGIGTLTDAFAAIRSHVYERATLSMDELLAALADDFAGQEPLRRRLLNDAPKYGTDDDAADDIMRACFEAYFATVDGRPNTRGGQYHIDMLPTTCHVYFGQVIGALPDGRRAGVPVSEGISPVQGADRRGPTAMMLSAAKMDHLRTGGTLLNCKFTPSLLAGDEGIENMGRLVRTYFRLNGHHVQFNVVRADTLRKAQAQPEKHRDLIVRVAGYSDYFCDLSRALQDEIIERTEHEGF
ncbi:MAG: glycyl radical protein [Armatimonadetes bacterium]|nr:glycyl radical protein [Armatimonadota bacterium]